MWVELVFQHLVLIADILGLQLLIFDKHGLLAADEIDDIAATGDEASYDEVAQRMQVVMYHCIDSRYVERLVKEYENLSQQVAENPGQDKGKDYFSSRNFDGSLVEVEQAKRISSERKVKKISLATSINCIPGKSVWLSKRSKSDTDSGKWMSTATIKEMMTVKRKYLSFFIAFSIMLQR